MTDAIKFFAALSTVGQKTAATKKGHALNLTVSGADGMVSCKFWRERGVEHWRVSRGIEVLAEGRFA